MKKLLALVLVMILSLTALVGCDVKESVGGFFDKVKDTVGGWFGIEPEPDPDDKPAVEYDVAAATEYVKTLYIKDPTATGSDYEVVSQVLVAGVKYTVTWTVDNEAVKVVPGELTTLIDVNEKSDAEVAYKLTFVVTAGDGTTGTYTFDRVVPEYKVLSYAEYIAAEDEAPVVIEGIITLARSKAAGNTRNQLFLQDVNGEGGYYVYGLKDDDVANLGLKVGMTVSVTGIKDIYGKTPEIKDGVCAIVDSTIKTPAPVDITEIISAAEDAKAETLMAKLGMLVTIKGAVVTSQDLSEKSMYLKFNIDGLETYVRVYTTDLSVGIMTKEEETAIIADHASHRDYTVNVTGVVDVYSDAIYISPADKTPFEYLTKVERTPEEKIDLELEALVLPSEVKENTVVTLPAVGNIYNDITLTWATDNDTQAAIADGKLNLVIGETNAQVKITVTATCGDKTDTKEFVIKLSIPVDYPATTTAPKADKAYYLFLYQATLNKFLYINGEVSSSRYLATTENVEEAAKLYAEAVEGGYKFYIVKDEVKQYITVFFQDINGESKLSVGYSAVDANVFSYVAETNSWKTTLDEKEYYIGTYKNYNTISASETKYITAENTGVEQFPANIAVVTPAKTEDINADTYYNAFIYQGTIEEVLYLNGGVDGRYLTTTTNPEEAAKIYAEVVEGGYKFYIVVEDVKQYIAIYKNADGKTSVGYFADNASVFAYVKTTNCWATSFDGKEYYLGTYKDFKTVSASETSYITVENTGVSQFPMNFTAVGFTLSDADKAKAEIDAIVLPENVVINTYVKLPAVGATYDDVVITWAAEGAEIVDGVLAIIPGEAEATVTVTANATVNGVTETKTYTVAVAKAMPSVVADIETSTPVVEGTSATSYAEYVTTNGWKVVGTRFESFVDGVPGWILNGKTSAPGKVTSPALSGAIKYIAFNYGFEFSDTQFKLNISVIGEDGTVLVSTVVEKTGLEKGVAYDYVWALTEEESAKLVGNYTIVIENACLSGVSDGNKDRLSIWNLVIYNTDYAHTHTYTDDCDAVCDGCGETTREAPHVYDNACDGDCNNCDATRTPADHVYDNACDAECNVCGGTRVPADHVYTDNCDEECDVCNAPRTAPHVYDNACDADCNACGETRTPADHVYDHGCDVDCNECGAVREGVSHEDEDKNNICDNCQSELDETGDTPIIDKETTEE